ncbi:MAG: hypothetical protein ACC657_16255 [Thiohalomonadales bacterium]
MQRKSHQINLLDDMINKTIFSFLISGLMVVLVSTITITEGKAESNPKIKDQMVCYASNTLTLLNKNYSKKSLTCMKRSTQSNYEYNNLAGIYAEGWIITDISNTNVWLFYK